MSGQSGSRLDQIVKGAAPLGTTVPSVASRSPSPAPSGDEAELRASQGLSVAQHSDPLTSLPSSPPQIYLNLLILEASLRSQYLTLRDRRRQNTFFILILTLWNAFFFYALFLRPREDGSGVGGSVYWVIEMAEKVALMGGIVTGILIWGTGQWDRGVRWPRRFVGIANRGLRTMNAKIVVIKGPWWKELLGHMVFLFPYSSFFPSQGSSYHYSYVSSEKRTRHGKEEEAGTIREEDLSPGGDHIKLLLLPKPFSPDFRENWELYRTEYWEKENERRAKVLRQLRQLERQEPRSKVDGYGGLVGVDGRGREGWEGGMGMLKNLITSWRKRSSTESPPRDPNPILETHPGVVHQLSMSMKRLRVQEVVGGVVPEVRPSPAAVSKVFHLLVLSSYPSSLLPGLARLHQVLHQFDLL